jgi:hypothetical protein
MGIDASIYQNVQPLQIANPADIQQKAMALSSLGLQQAQQMQTIQQQQGARQAYQDSIDPQTGQLNQQGYLSQLAQINPQMAMDYQSKMTEQAKNAAEAKSAQQDAVQKTISTVMPGMEVLNSMPEDQRAAAAPQYFAQWKQQGVDMPGFPTDSDGNHLYDPKLFQAAMQNLNKTKPYQDQQAAAANIANTQSGTAKNIAETAKAQAETEKTQSETYKRNPDITGQTNDPAKLVPTLVPKEHQAAAFNEIDAAENTKKMSSAIMNAFDQADQENTALKTGAGMLRTPPSVGALHQALQPTFKDLEGTVRQAAMENTFKNVTPAPGDLPSTVATKRLALEQYLQSKASAPTARAYGIDLSKFDSTSAYKSPNAAKPVGPKPGDVEDGHVFMGGYPSQQSSWMKDH